MKKILTVIILLLFIGLSINPSTGYGVNEKSINSISDDNTLYVGGSGPGNYTNIRDAIDNASDGDTVFVFNDSSPYYENVFVEKSINLIGEDKETTIIDGGEINDVVCISMEWVNISGFTLRNSSEYAAGIILRSYCNLTGNIITQNNGSGIVLSGGWFGSCCSIIYDNIITNNKFNGIDLYRSESNSISGNTISNNGNGIYTYGDLNGCSCDNIISDNIISSNEDDGIIFDMDSGSNTITGNTISKNHYGIKTGYSGDNTIINNNILNNYCGIMPSGYGDTVTGNTISKNSYGMKLEGSKYCNIKDNNINSNTVYGIYLGPYCRESIIANNNIADVRIYSGMKLHTSFDNIITGNTISEIDDEGITLVYSNGNNIIGNNISNTRIGISLDFYSDNNLIYCNNFIKNYFNALDKCDNNWDNGKYGNYWSDYKEKYPFAIPKLNKPWMWNIPYEIPGGDNKDNCPLVKNWPNSASKEITQNKAINRPILNFLQRFFESHSNIFPFLQQLLKILNWSIT